jgi:hypothetical protein
LSRIPSYGLAVFAAVLLTVRDVFASKDYRQTQPQPLVAAVEADRSESASTPRYLSQDVRYLEVAQDNVLAHNPLEDETESPLGEIVSAEWRVVVLAVSLTTKDTKCTQNAQKRHIASLQPEVRFFRVFRVFRGSPKRTCPIPNPSDRHLVTTKFIHENAEILDVRIEGSAEAIGTTASQPYWSENRQSTSGAIDSDLSSLRNPESTSTGFDRLDQSVSVRCFANPEE